MHPCTGSIWDRITDGERVALCNYQWDNYGTQLDLFNQSQKQKAVMDTIPENDDLGRFMAQAPEHQAHVV